MSLKIRPKTTPFILCLSSTIPIKFHSKKPSRTRCVSATLTSNSQPTQSICTHYFFIRFVWSYLQVLTFIYTGVVDKNRKRNRETLNWKTKTSKDENRKLKQKFVIESFKPHTYTIFENTTTRDHVFSTFRFVSS